MTAVPDHSLLARLDTQPRVRDFISRAVAATRAFAWRAIRIRTFTCWRPNPRPAT